MTVCLVAAFVGAMQAEGNPWRPIMGIPEPPFGVKESSPSPPNPWSVETGGFYFICPTCAGADDAGNMYGYPAKPRKSIPGVLPPGSVVEIHGQYDTVHPALVVNGTFQSPVFIRSAGRSGRAKLTGRITMIGGKYVIFENLWFGPADKSSTSFGLGIKEGAAFIAVRNCEFSGNLKKAGGISVGTWRYALGDAVANVVIDNCYIHDNGNIGDTGDQDKHGVTLNGKIDNLWLVNSELARNSGDGIQVTGSMGVNTDIRHIYIGRNVSHGNKQTGFWIKNATDVIISENKSYGHRRSSSGLGDGMGLQYGPDYVWFIFNHIYDCDFGIRLASDHRGAGLEHFIIGNDIHNIHSQRSANKASPWGPAAIAIWGGKNTVILNNTIWDIDAGINSPRNYGKLEIINNIIDTPVTPSASQIFVETPPLAEASTFGWNLLRNPTRLRWGRSTEYPLSSLRSRMKFGRNSLSTDAPIFVDPGRNDYRLRPGSPAIDQGTEHAAYAIFRSRYGMDIARDINGTMRPQGSNWDIGAYEDTRVIDSPAR